MSGPAHQTTAFPPSQCPSFCLDCRYDLSASLSHSCPECGRWFDPEDPRTFYNKRRPGRLALAMMTPAGWPSFAFGLALSLLVLVTFSVPAGGYFTLFLILAIALPIVVIAFFCDLLVSVVVSFRMGRSWLFSVRSDGTRVWRRVQTKWLIAPLMVIVTLVITAWQVPARVTFRLSRKSLLAAISDPPSGPTYIGLLPVREVMAPIQPADGAPYVRTIWLSEGGGLLNEIGFAHAPGHKNDWLDLGIGGRGWRYSGDWFLMYSD
ncbi:MAG: hypothetical protein P8J45_08220 [Phycisphaerales bacterium]|nr:hypothetical protein [Phycisphaerales bacterium]